jgi:hypothetical protein
MITTAERGVRDYFVRSLRDVGDLARVEALADKASTTLHPRRIGLGDHPAECCDAEYLSNCDDLLNDIVELFRLDARKHGLRELPHAPMEYPLVAAQVLLTMFGELVQATRQEAWAYRRDYSICWKTPDASPLSDAKVVMAEHLMQLELLRHSESLAAALCGPSVIEGQPWVELYTDAMRLNPMYIGVGDTRPLLSGDEWSKLALWVFREHCKTADNVALLVATILSRVLIVLNTLRICIGHGNPDKIGYVTTPAADTVARYRFMPSLEALQHLVTAYEGVDEEFIFQSPQHVDLVPSRPVDW